MKRQRFFCFMRFAWNTDIPLSGKKGETPQLANNWKSITRFLDNFVLLVVPGLSSPPAAVCLQHRDQRISKIVQKIGTIIRSSPDSKWQACMRETDADRSWQAGHGKPWTSRRKKKQTRCTRRIQRKAFLIGYSPSQLILKTWRCMCSHILVKEWTQIRKAMLQKWSYEKREHSILTHFRKYRKRSIIRTEEIGDLKTVERNSESRNNHQFAAVE